MSRFVLASLLSLLLAGACAAPPPPATPPAYTEAPPAVSGEGYVTYVATRELPVPAETARIWIEESRMLGLLKSTDKVSKPLKSESLKGTWPQTGAVRRVTQADGHFIAERIVENTESSVMYQIYAMTGPAGRSVSYGIGEFRVTAIDANRCTFTWTYELKPKNAITGFFVNRFVQNDFAPFMEGGMDAMVELAASVED